MSSTATGVGLGLALSFTLFLFLLSRRPAARAARREKRLRARFLRKSQMPRALALELLDRQIARLEERFPERVYLWHLERAVDDLDRDRR